MAEYDKLLKEVQTIAAVKAHHLEMMSDNEYSYDNAKFVDKSPSDKDNVAISSTALDELEISDRLYHDLR